MNTMKNWSFLMLLMIFIPIIQSCGDDEVDLNSYIVGEWRSFKLMSQLGQQSREVEVTKTGVNSQIYYEITFKKDGTCIMSSWETDSKTLSSWITEYGTYSIQGNTITITDDTDTVSMFFDESERSLYLRVAGEVEGYGYMTNYIYFRK